MDADSHKRTRWGKERIARLGFLVGRGFTAQSASRDPIIAATPSIVQRQAQRFGLAFREGGQPIVPPPATDDPYEAAAAKRGMTRDAVIRLFVLAGMKEPVLIDNVIDDGV